VYALAAHTGMHRRRLAAAVSLAVVGALAVGAGAASAGLAGGASSKAQLVVTTFPAGGPVAGSPFTITFSLVADGVKEPISRPDCLGMTSHRPIALEQLTLRRKTASCTWMIPASHGPTFDGMLVAFDRNGVEYYYGYDFPIG
jgi:hypothetical protein